MRAARVVLIGLIGWSLFLPLQDLLAYPDRVSVLPNLQTDAPAYYAIAADLAASRSLDALPVRHPPGWVSMLALIYSVTGPAYVPGKLLSWLALVASVAGCAYLARRVYSTPAAWIAALLCASSPALRGYVGTLQYEVMTGTELLALIVLALRAIDADDHQPFSPPGLKPGPSLLRRAALAGIVGGLLVLTRETFLVIVPLVALWMAHQVRRTLGPRAAIAAAAVMLAATLLPAAGWSAVQSARAGTLITISEKGSMVVELGNNPLANGTYNATLVGIGQPTGIAFVRQYPGRTLVLAGRKVLYFWGVLRDGWNVPRPSAVWFWRASTGLVPLEWFAVLARGGWLLLVFLGSLWMLGPTGLARWWALPAVVVMLMAVHIVTLSSHRFAVPILPVVFVLASGPLTAAARAALPALRAPAVGLAVAVLLVIIVAMQFQTWPLTLQRRAVDLDGLQADNVIDPISKQAVRAADARRGMRPIVLLTDEYLPRGPLITEVRMRRTSATSPDAQVARLALVTLDGHVACARDLIAKEVPDDCFESLTMPCRLPADGPATFALYSLGGADLAVEDLRMSWTSGK